ncbi:MAG TPA: AAA family ATPase [Allosphingosinicella sp.]
MTAASPSSPGQAPVSRAPRWPRWLDEIDLTLAICPQFVLYGNVRDDQLVPVDDMLVQVPLIDALWMRLRPRGYRFMLVYDRTAGLWVHPADAVAGASIGSRFAPLGGAEAPLPIDPSDIPALIQAVYESGCCSLVIQNASRITDLSGGLSAEMLELFAACAQSVQAAAPRQPGPSQPQPLYNPVFWLVDAVQDLPAWLSSSGERSRAICLASPDREDRYEAALGLVPEISAALTAEETHDAALEFALRAEGLALKEMAAVAHIARDRGLHVRNIAAAIRCYKVGVTDDPWSSPLLRSSIEDGETAIRAFVKGQDAAVQQTLDILKRSVMGLHGAQASSSSSRPRGILFFAGPTGVGKTELAKAVGRLVFGNEDACIRFDMSEFSSEHSDARLIGAPPGYVGHDAGGELVNAVRQRPFSVILFDEIEKAHPRILDKFLQILEDGRLTDSRGDTVYFSEAILIFTSNLGIGGEDEDGNPRLTPNDPYDTVKETVLAGIETHFRERVGRPELHNRLGDNIVVFNYIDEHVAEQIFDKAVANIFARVASTEGLSLRFGPGVREELVKICCENRAAGGRGVGNRLETALINPLARALFSRTDRGTEVEIAAIAREGSLYSVTLA